MCVVRFAIAEIGQMSRSSTHTKQWTRQQLRHCTQRLNHEDISMLCFKTLLAVVKDVKMVKNQDGGLQVPLFDLKQCLTLSNLRLDAKNALVLKHQFIVPSTLLAPATNIRA